jgi:poly-gamma-glutamate system protein
VKALYWRPPRVSTKVLLLVSFVTLCALLTVERFRIRERQPHHAEKTQATALALRAFRVLKQARLERSIPIDVETDPGETGLVGELISPITTNNGFHGAKLTSINPNFAAVMVELLRRAGVRDGDTVAVGMSGSFPALNVAVYAALHTLRCRALVVSSIGSSQWGANHPDFTWADMEKVLVESGTIPYRSLAVSPGGIDDRALGLSQRGRRMLDAAMERSGLGVLGPKDYKDSLDQRMSLYREHAGPTEIRAYVNVGGGTTSVGTRVGKDLFKPGLNTKPPRGHMIDSVMKRFVERGVPIIHLTRIDELASRYGLPVQPTGMPAVGEGATFYRTVYSRWLALAGLVVIAATLFMLMRLDIGYRLLASRGSDTGGTRPEPMV